MVMEPQIIISKTDALQAYGGNGAALARALGLTKQAVSAMPEGPLLERHALKLRFVLKPEVFNKPCGDVPAVGVPANTDHEDKLMSTG